MILKAADPTNPISCTIVACNECGEQTDDLTGWEGDESTETHYCPYHKRERQNANNEPAHSEDRIPTRPA